MSKLIVLLSLLFSVYAEASCELQLMGMAEVRERFQELGVTLDRAGKVIASNERTPIAKTIGKIIKNHPVSISMDPYLKFSGAFYHAYNQITLGGKPIQRIFETAGRFIPQTLLHETGHRKTFGNPSLEGQVRSSVVAFKDLPLHGFRTIHLTYDRKFFFDELVTYRKDLRRFDSLRRGGEEFNSESFRAAHRALGEFIAATQDVVHLLNEASFDPTKLTIRSGGATEMDLGASVKITLPSHHTFNLLNPEILASSYLIELTRLLRHARKTYQEVKPPPLEMP